MSKILITQQLFDNINYDMEHLQVANAQTAETSQPTLLVVFSSSDINAAIYHLVKSLENPFEAKAVASVLVQEAIKEDFVQKLQAQLKPYAIETLKNIPFVNALDTIKKLSAEVITVADATKVGPTLVQDFTFEQLGITKPCGVVTFHTFRTAKEAIALGGKESMKFSNVSIWHSNHAYSYELVAALKSNLFFINCFDIPITQLEETIAQGKSFVTIDKSYHYETMPHDGLQKSIIFPIGSIFAN